MLVAKSPRLAIMLGATVPVRAMAASPAQAAGGDSDPLQGPGDRRGFRADIIVTRTVILEIKAVAAPLPVHEAQLHTYFKLSGLRIVLLLNFNVRRLTKGIRRYVL